MTRLRQWDGNKWVLIGTKGDTGPMGISGMDGITGMDGIKGEDGKDAKVDTKELRELSEKSVKKHEKKFDHKLLHDASLLGTKIIDESSIGDNKFVGYNKELDKLVYLEPPTKQKSVRTGGGTSHIKYLSDVTLTPLVDNDLLAYDAASNQWINQNADEAGLGSGDVSKVGTPVDNQIGVWTGDGTIEGDTNFTWDGSTLDIVGAITVSGNVDGRDLSTDGSKLDGIEVSADVTDTANVTSAGALMDSEVDADIKTLLLPANTTISSFGASLIDDAAASNARTTLDVDQAGTDNSTDVTLAGTPNYLTLSGQEITLTKLDISDDTNLVAGTGLALSTNTLSVDLNELTTETSIAAGDFIVMVDITDSGSGKITFTNLESSLTITESQISDLGSYITNISGLAPDTATTAAAQPNITSLGTLTSLSMSGDIDLNGNNIDDGGVIFLREQAEADADVTGQGQIWVNTATPNELFFTDDAGTDFQLGLAGAVPTTITVADESADTTCFVSFFTDATGDLGPKTGSNLTFNSSSGLLTATSLGGTLTTAAQTNVTSLGTLTALQVDNLNLNGNTLSSTAGTDLNITPLTGQQIVLDGTIVIDAGVVTGATSITSTSFVGALTGNADTVTTNANLTGEITSVGNAAVLDVTAISGQTLVTAVATDMVLIEDATDGTLKRVDASDFLAGSGDVTKVGTPVNNQVGVWTGDGTIEGDTALTFDTTTDTLAIAASGDLAFGAVIILSDSAGTTTLQNIDALDATTETTIETAIDTLTNLTSATSLVSVGTITTGTWQGTTIAVNQGGTGQTTYTNGQLLIGNTTGNTLTKATLTEGAGIDITNGTGTITIAGEAASVTNAGIIEVATAAETTTGTDATRAVSPDGFAGSDHGVRIISILLNDSTALTTGDGKAHFRLPAELNGYNLIGAFAARSGGTGVPSFQIHNVTDAVDVLSTNITIDSGETDSSTAATAPVINAANDDVDSADRWRIDVDVAGTSTTFAEVQMTFQLP